MKKIELSYQKNVRDLGGLVGYQGKKVKFGRIYRGGFLGRVSKKDIEILNGLHITDIIDLRGPDEFKNKPDHKFKGVTYHNFPPFIEKMRKEEEKYDDGNLLFFVGDALDGFTHMYKMYPQLLLSDMGKEAYGNILKLLETKEDGVFYFHCSQGKDRAGIASYLIEIALGVSEDTARMDYMLTNEAMVLKIKELKGMLKDKSFYNEKYEKALLDVFEAKEEYLDNAINAVNEKYGSMLNYIENELKIDVNKLRSLYLED